VWRRSAVERIGGVPEGMEIEDLYLSYALYSEGYITRFHKEILSNGLATETFAEYVNQRCRWARGCLQGFFKPFGAFGVNRQTFMQRLNMLSVQTYWISQIFYPLFFFGPILYWLFGIATLNADLTEILRHGMPYMLFHLFYGMHVNENKAIPWISSIPQIASSLQVARAVLELIAVPWKKMNHVTSKGISKQWKVFHVKFSLYFMAICATTLFGLFSDQLSPIPLVDRAGVRSSTAVVFWSSYTVLVSLVCFFISIDVPRLRACDRFIVDETAVLHAGKEVKACHIQDLSMTGARIELKEDIPISPREPLFLDIPHVGVLKAWVVRTRRRIVCIRFFDVSEFRKSLTVKLYTGGYRSSPVKIRGPAFLWAVLKRIFE